MGTGAAGHHGVIVFLIVGLEIGVEHENATILNQSMEGNLVKGHQMQICLVHQKAVSCFTVYCLTAAIKYADL